MEKNKNWLDTYLTPAKELVGYKCYVSCDYEKNSAKGHFSVIIIKNGEVVTKEKNHIYCTSKAVVIVEAILFMMQKCENADVITIHSKYFKNYFAFFNEARKANAQTKKNYLSLYKSFRKDVEVIYDLTTWYKRNEYDDEVEKMLSDN
ncbi:hypothetical protein [Phascolarctobacterium sp.]|uniref:hypothetical protein n=1 Tax=Phascolarctobacterium sp. TaxID=2049039 RepID=UPI0025FEDD24|nr:hypothetical protein [Phascolarctobacterium sp.]